MEIRFDGQVVMITGAGAGLGRCHALEFARRGAKVVVNDLGPEPDGSAGPSENAKAVVAEIEAMGGEAMAHGASVTNQVAVGNMVQEVMERFGRIDVLVNNAGILGDKSFHNMTLEGFQKVLDVHLMGTVTATHAVWPIMREQAYGRVIVTTSSSGLYGNFGQSNYGAGKMGVLGLISTLKLEGEKYNIRCAALAPTAWTQMTADIFPPEAEDMFKPEKVSPAVIYLAGPDAPSGTILCAGAGGFARAALMESPGVYLGPDASAEDIAANWDAIASMDQAVEHFAGLEQPQKMTRLYQSG
ncbi:MAG: SDR family NAD(P)-dependent oxidoreductase [Alphaproteobacteria bacterium]|nr:SDR family NAD(P)-dependent oxidoreductase [Alphaproteobacteria bacterium]